jgi:hypothetical protein
MTMKEEGKDWGLLLRRVKYCLSHLSTSKMKNITINCRMTVIMIVLMQAS